MAEIATLGPRDLGKGVCKLDRAYVAQSASFWLTSCLLGSAGTGGIFVEWWRGPLADLPARLGERLVRLRSALSLCLEIGLTYDTIPERLSAGVTQRDGTPDVLNLEGGRGKALGVTGRLLV